MFAKIFSSIYDSSIAEDWQTRIVFQDMLVLADKDGILDMTPTSIARRTNIPLRMVQDAIPKLEAPDPLSRTPDHDGRRIVRLDAHREWGWRIVNYIKYRESATKEMLRMAEADRKRAYRARHGKPSPFPTPLTPEIQKQRGEADMSTDMSGTSANPPPDAALLRRKREPWQLTKDAKAIREQLNAEKEKQNPDKGVLAGLRTELKAIKDEWRRIGDSNANPPSAADDGPALHSTPSRNAGTYNEGRDISGLKKLIR